MSTTPHFMGKVGVKAIIVKDDKVLMVRADNELMWDLPGGRIHVGEGLTETLARELTEELGVATTVGRFIHSCQVVHSTDGTNQLYATYEATLVDPDTPFKADPTEAAQLTWVGKGDLATLQSYDNCLAALHAYWNL